jgi:16S rRNA (guanine527-N7)-methyltransferase
MDEARIVELLAPFLSDDVEGGAKEGAAGTKNPAVLSPVLFPAQAKCISTYIDLLRRWNDRINLTSVREPEEIVTRHFGESIFAARRLFPQGHAAAGLCLIDIGSGAGFPGLPIKIWAAHIHVTLIESNQKKATFLREVVRSLRLESVDVFAGRADTFSRAAGDVVVLRAVEHFDSILPVAASLARPRGRVAILVGESQLGQVRELTPGMKWDEPVRIPLSRSRLLIIGSSEPEE